MCLKVFTFLSFFAVAHGSYLDDISISFTPDGYYLLTSWVQDIGEEFGLKTIHETHTKITRNFTFGWNRDLTEKTWHVDIESLTYLSKYAETGITLNPCDAFDASPCDIWNIELPNGVYDVTVILGKPPHDKSDDPNAPSIVDIPSNISTTVLCESYYLYKINHFMRS